MPSQTLRPIAILTTADRVIYQAIVNVVAEFGRAALSIIANRQSFANVLSDIGKKPMFVSWKVQYIYHFQSQFRSIIEEEQNSWIAETDVAAFYETIDHDKLFEILLKDNFIDEKILEGHLKIYLPVWASVKNDARNNRGIPQGSLASDLLANVFLHEFDADLATQEYHYLRYVDDIRLLANDKSSIQRGLIHIDKTLKSLGLLIQTKKTTVREIKDIDDELDRMASLLSDIDRQLRQAPDTLAGGVTDPLIEPVINDVALMGEELDTNLEDEEEWAQEQLIQLFWIAKLEIDGENDKGTDLFAERHLRFCLSRLDPDPEIGESLLPYIENRPWMAENIFRYLKKCNPSNVITNFLRQLIINHKVYDHIVTLSIETLIQQGISLRAEQYLFRNWLSTNKRDWQLLSAAVMALGESANNLQLLITVIRQAPSPSVRRMAVVQALRLSRNQDETIYILKLAIRDPSPIVIDTVLYLLYVENNLTLEQLGVSKELLTDYCRSTAKGYDASLPDVGQCYIRHVLIKHYNVQILPQVDFHILLGIDYDRTINFLWQAQNSFFVIPSRYVSQLDLFHEELLYPILVDKIQWKTTREDAALVAFPDRMKYLQNQKRELSLFANALADCHILRSSCTEAHTRLHRALGQTTPVDYQQRDRLKQKLIAGYQQLVDWLAAGCP